MRRKRLLLGLGAVLLLAGGAASYLWYQATHIRIDLKLNDEQLEKAQIALKGSIGRAIFSPKQNEPLLQKSATNSENLESVMAPNPSASEGLIDDYERNPQEYERYAQMLDTALNAMHVGKVALNLASSRIPSSSSQLPLDSKAKVDSWGSPFCLVPLVGRLAVVSGGPTKTPCNALPLSIEQLNRSERTVFAGPSESVIVIASKRQ
jgi:hypothetical protein